MCLTYSFKFGIFFLPLCRCFFVEISLSDRNESKSIKLICGPPAENRNLKGNHTVLWHGSQFGADEQQKLTETMQTDALVPNISISSSKRHRCYLLTTDDAYKSVVPHKKRVSREDLEKLSSGENPEASIPTENGNCPPGYRIDQDRCFPCFPGSYTSGQDSVCYLCPKDFYIDKKAADSCWPCPEGKKTLAQGADSEESCVYFDESGHPTAAQSPPWAAIFSLIGVIIAFVWIIIIILFVRYWRNRDDTDQTEKVERGQESRSSKPLLTSKSGDQFSESGASQPSDPEDNIYAEIGDFTDDADIYEVPRKPSNPPEYVEILPEVLEQRPKKSSSQVVKKDSVEDHLYEIPRKASTQVGQQDSVEDHLYEIPIPKKSDSHSYEIPVRRSSKRSESGTNNIYDEVPIIDQEQEFNEDFPKNYSTGFEPSSSMTRVLPRTSSESRRQRQSRQSDFSVREMTRSDHRMSHVPEENEYDISPDDESNIYDMPADEEESIYDLPPVERGSIY